MTVISVFTNCVKAIRNNRLIGRVSATDKEFHFQNWFQTRLEEIEENYEVGGRNAYPDFRMVASTDGYELKGLAYPGRDARLTAIAKSLPATITGERFTTSLAAIRRFPTGIPIPCSILSFVTGAS